MILLSTIIAITDYTVAIRVRVRVIISFQKKEAYYAP